MRHFATESGKSKGQFYTPAEVSRIMAKVIGASKASSPSQTIYDPTCGSGSLLLKANDESPVRMTIYGQEMENDNLKTFDFVVANPPFSNKAWSNGFDPAHDLYSRFADGVPPQKNGDYAFLLHVIRSLKSAGKGAIILPHGVLFRGNAEGEIRENIIRKGYIKGIIGLPANLFYGTGIPACIIVIDKENAANRRGIFMIDASKGFVKDGNKNRLRHQDIHKIVDVFNKQIEAPKYARMVPVAEIEANDYNLNIPRYIDSAEAEDLHDIAAHLLGGIPNRDIDALDAYWQVFPTLKQQLFEAGSRAGYSSLRVDTAHIKADIYSNPEFTAYTSAIADWYLEWQKSNMTALKSLDVGSSPKRLIETLSEDMLRVFARVRLIDKYDVYQRLMSYWSDTMQDDVYMIALDGWRANSDLVPPQLIIKRYFAADQQHIETLEAAREAITRQMEEMEEEHGGEGGLLEEAKNEKGKITKATGKARLRDIFDDPDAEDEQAKLNAYLDLPEQEAEAKKKVRDAQEELDAKVASRYKTLSEDEVKTLVVDDKWLDTLINDIQKELNRISQALTGRIKELAERYATPLPKLSEVVEDLSRKVDEHLKKMGFVWR